MASKARILIIDDDTEFAADLTLLLQSQFEVVTAEDDKSGLAAAQRHDPDVVYVPGAGNPSGYRGKHHGGPVASIMVPHRRSGCGSAGRMERSGQSSRGHHARPYFGIRVLDYQ